MKKLGIKWALVICLFTSLVACEKNSTNDSDTTNTEGKTRTIVVEASLGDITKTTYEQEADGKYKAQWCAGDVLYIAEIATVIASDGTVIARQRLDFCHDFFVASEPLAQGGETAQFTFTLSNERPQMFQNTYLLNDSGDDWDGNLESYNVRYSYMITTADPWYCKAWYGNGDDYYNPSFSFTDPNTEISFDLWFTPEMQNVFAGGIYSGDALLISPLIEMNERASEDLPLKATFARAGCLMKLNLTGLPTGLGVMWGELYTSSEYCPRINNITYRSRAGKYSYSNGDDNPADKLAFDVFSGDHSGDEYLYSDSNGNLSIFLRCLPGEMRGGFKIILTANGSIYSRSVSLSKLGRTLKFIEGGFTEFTVGLKPACELKLISGLDYNTKNTTNRSGFVASWVANSSYVEDCTCYLSGNGIERTELPVTIENGAYHASIDGLNPGYYELFVESNLKDDAPYGPGPGCSDNIELCIGEPKSIELNKGKIESDVMYYYDVNDINMKRPLFSASLVNYKNNGQSLNGIDPWSLHTNLRSYEHHTGLGGLELSIRNLEEFNRADDLSVMGYKASDNSYTSLEPTNISNSTYAIYYTYDLSGYDDVKVWGTKDCKCSGIFTLKYYK